MIYIFKRYRNGAPMAQGVRVTKARTFEDACARAAKLAPAGDVLVLERMEPPEEAERGEA